MGATATTALVLCVACAGDGVVGKRQERVRRRRRQRRLLPEDREEASQELVRFPGGPWERYVCWSRSAPFCFLGAVTAVSLCVFSTVFDSETLFFRHSFVLVCSDSLAP